MTNLLQKTEDAYLSISPWQAEASQVRTQLCNTCASLRRCFPDMWIGSHMEAYFLLGFFTDLLKLFRLNFIYFC